MACSCKGRATTRYLWTSDDGTENMIYKSEIEAKAKVLRKGGTYKPLGA